MRDPAVQQQPGDSVHRSVVAQCRAGPGQAGQVHRGVVVHERQRDELRETPGAVLDAGQGPQVGDPVPGVVDVAVHHRRAARDAEAVGGLDHPDPLSGGQLALGQHPPDVVVEDLGGRAGNGAEAGVAQVLQQIGHADAGPGGAGDDLHRAEGVDVHPGGRVEHGAHDLHVGVGAHVRADTGLDAHLGGAQGLGLRGAYPDLGQGQRVGVRVAAALCEGAEPAADVADVGDVEVAVDDVGDVIADGVSPHLVGEPAHRVQVGAVRLQQRQVAVVVEAGGGVGGPGQGGGHLPRRYVAGRGGAGPQPVGDHLPVPVHAGEVAAPIRRATGAVDVGVQVHPAVAGAGPAGPAAVRLLPGPPGGRGRRVREPGVGIGQRRDVAVQPGVDPRHLTGKRGPDVAWVGSQAFGQAQSRGLGDGAQYVQLRPGTFGVDVVGGQRADAAPVVDTRGEQPGEVAGVAEIGRRLYRHRGPEQQPGHRDRRQVLLVAQVGLVAHRRVRLRAEVLHDDLLDAAVLPGDAPDRQQRVDPLGRGLPDAQQHTRGEWDPDPAGVLEHPQPNAGILVRAAEVRPAGLRPQPGGGGLQHHAHRGRDRP